MSDTEAIAWLLSVPPPSEPLVISEALTITDCDLAWATRRRDVGVRGQCRRALLVWCRRVKAAMEAR